MAFLVLSAVGIVYIAGSYLGLVDRVLGRGFTIHATLPTSGGLFEGSEVTYRGVKVGEVKRMHVARDGVRLDLAMEDGVELPLDSPMFVHNLSAVGEQYLDFEPPTDEGPYAEPGDTIVGTDDSLPVDEADLLVELDQFVESVDKENLQVVVRELGLMFNDTGVPLQKLIDSGGEFIDEAAAHEDETVALLENGMTVLRTQRDQGENIRSFSRDLRLITQSLRRSDGDLRGVLQGTPGAAREIEALMKDLEPTLPVLLGNAVSLNQVVVSHLNGLEQLLVTFPRTISSGFTGTPPARRRPGQPAVLQQGAAVHRGLHAEEPVAPRRPDLGRADLPGGVQLRAAVRHAGHEVRPRRPPQPRLRRPRLPQQLRPRDRRRRRCRGRLRQPRTLPGSGQPVDPGRRLVEVAAGRAGGPTVTPDPTSRVRLNIALYVLALVVACACVVGGVVTWRTHDDRSSDAAEQERYGDVLASATAEAEAFINIRYDDAQQSIDEVAAGATGEFREQYASSTDGVIEVLEENRSVMDGEVLWAGVVDVDNDSATVIAATTGTVSNNQTDNKPVVRNFRLQLDLVLEDGRWLTRDLQFVS